MNTYTTGDQYRPGIAPAGSGGFVVTWVRLPHFAADLDVFAQVFDSAGAPVGSEFRVNTFTRMDQYQSRVAGNNSGEFIVTWTSMEQDGSGTGVFAQRYEGSGIPVGGEFQVSSVTADNQNRPAIALSASGAFVIVYVGAGHRDGSSLGVFGQRFDGTGQAVGAEFQANAYTTGNQTNPRIALDGDDGFLIVWDDSSRDGSSRGVFARRFDATDAPSGPDFQVNTYTTSTQYFPAVTSNDPGDFLIVWTSNVQDGSFYGVFGQLFDSAGSPKGAEYLVNTTTFNAQRLPAVAADPRGGFLVTWDSESQDGSLTGVFGRRSESGEAPTGHEFLVNTYTTASQRRPDLLVDPEGDFIVVWSSSGQDGSLEGIFGQRFFGRSPVLTAPLEGDTLDCSDPRGTRPTMTWDPDGYDQFRVFLGADPEFPRGSAVTSGDRLLTSSSWQPGRKAWRRACDQVLRGDSSNSVLFVRVLGIDRDLPKRSTARERYSPTVHVAVTP